jgi:hypothetical protein
MLNRGQPCDLELAAVNFQIGRVGGGVDRGAVDED